MTIVQPSADADEEVRRGLKALKAIGDKTAEQYEAHLHRVVTFGNDVITLRGETWHQLALRSVGRVDYIQSAKRFEAAKAAISQERQPLTYARVLRDEAWFVAHHQGDHYAGRRIINAALRLHEKDLELATNASARAKARRQRLITQTYGWRIDHSYIGSSESIAELLRVIEHEGQQFCARDQLVIMEYLIPRVGFEVRTRLQLRASKLNAPNGSILLLPYRATLSISGSGLSIIRWLNRTIREG